MKPTVTVTALMLCLVLLFQPLTLFPAAAQTVPVTYELYDYFSDLENARQNGQPYVSDSPWSVQIKPASGEWSSPFDTASRDGSYTYFYDSGRAWGMYPGFAFNTGRGNGDRLYLNLISPTNSAADGSWRINTAYTFRAPADGCYSLGLADQLQVYSFADCNYAHQWDTGRAIDFGLRVTVNDRTVWPASDGEIRDGFRVFGTDTAADREIALPQINDLFLRAGEELRYEFTSFTPIPDSPWTQRICGTPSVTFTGPAELGDVTDVSWDHRCFAAGSSPAAVGQTLTGDSLTDAAGCFSAGKRLRLTALAPQGLGTGLTLRYGAVSVRFAGENSGFFCGGCPGVPFSCPENTAGRYDLGFSVQTVTRNGSAVGCEVRLSVGDREFSARFPVAPGGTLTLSGGSTAAPVTCTGVPLRSGDPAVRIDRLTNVILLDRLMTGKYFAGLLGDPGISAPELLTTGSTVTTALSSEVFTAALRFDATGDGHSDIRDLVRAKKGLAGTAVLSAAQILALTGAEEYSVTARTLAALRVQLLCGRDAPVLHSNLVYSMAEGSDLSENLISGWNVLSGSVSTETAAGHDGVTRTAYRMTSGVETDSGIYTAVASPTAGTYRLSGYSRTDGVTRTVGTEYYSYSLVASVGFADGTVREYSTTFSEGTHGWEYRETFFTLAKAPVSMTVYVFLRDPARGTASFESVSLVRGGADTLTFHDRPVRAASRDALPTGETALSSGDGLTLTLGNGGVTSVTANGTDLTSAGVSGFLARDVAAQAHTGVFGFDGSAGADGKYTGESNELGLAVEATFTEKPHCISVSGVLRDTTDSASGRAVELTFALPVAGSGKTWSAAIDEQMTVGTDDRAVFHSYAPGTMEIVDWDSEKHSYSPVSALYDGQTGLAMASAMDFPTYWTLEYNAGAGCYCVTYQLGITGHSPDAARFSFDIYLLDEPSWGYRAALEKYRTVHPDYYTVREKKHGLWNAWLDVTGIPSVADFNIRFKENDGASRTKGAQEVLRGVKAYYYIEPGDWWMQDVNGTDRQTLDDRFAQLAAGDPTQTVTQQAIAAPFCAGTDLNGNYNADPASTDWCPDGVQLHVNANPALPGRYNFYNLYYNDSVRNLLFNSRYMTGTAVFDGIYLDELQGWWRGNANFNPAHFGYTTVPLTYSPDHRAPMLHRASTTWEFVHALAGSLHADGKTLMANKAIEKNVFYLPLVDITGTEQTAMNGTQYAPQSISTLATWRSMAYTKPFCILLSNDYDLFDHTAMEKYFCRCMTYGIFPSPHDNYNHGGQYFSNAAYYERDRDLFRKYMPALKAMSEAGWEPVTGASADGLTVERFGSLREDGVSYLAVYNAGGSDRTASVRTDESLSGLTVTDALNGGTVSVTNGAAQVTVPAERVTVLKLTAD